jgi:hypothetical protein
MTKFRRDSFLRTSVNGNMHLVRSHDVCREDWERDSGELSHDEQLEETLANLCVHYSRTAWLVQPNANCPVCEEPVFFYQNEHGSKVYFDELGPPWPKHACMDVEPQRGNHKIKRMQEEVQPCARPDHDIETIKSCIESLPPNLAYDYEYRYGTKQWPAATVVKRIRSGRSMFVILIFVAAGKKERVLLSCNGMPRCVKEGSIVLVGKNSASFFDLASMKPGVVSTKRIKTATRFIEEIISAGVMQ